MAGFIKGFKATTDPRLTGQSTKFPHLNPDTLLRYPESRQSNWLYLILLLPLVLASEIQTLMCGAPLEHNRSILEVLNLPTHYSE